MDEFTQLENDAVGIYDAIIEPGPHTTEWWGTVASSAFALIVVLVTLINPSWAKLTSTDQSTIVGGLTVALPLLWGWYTKLRTDLKKSAHATVAAVLSSKGAPSATVSVTNLSQTPATTGVATYAS